MSQKTTAADILRAGIGHMADRAATYNRPRGERSMAATVEAFNAVTGDGLMNTEERGWLFMVLLKAVRSQQGDFKLDNYEDLAAYSGLAGEAACRDRALSWPPVLGVMLRCADCTSEHCPCMAL